MSQLISLGLLGIAGFAVFKRSQKVSKNIDSKPLHVDQEKSARIYVSKIVQENLNPLGSDLYNAMQSTNWVSLDVSKIKDDTIISFPSEYPSITYGQLVQMNGLQVMQMSNLARLNPDSTPEIFELSKKKLQKTVGGDLIANLTALLDK